MQFFDGKGDFIDMAAFAFPILSSLVFFDLLQLILSGALRGSGNVKTVLAVRLCICFGYFFPVSYIIAHHIPIENIALKFILIYSSFYIGNAIMSIVYIKKFRSDQWHLQN
jgi:Na+-driven multidrug efflux pump